MRSCLLVRAGRSSRRLPTLWVVGSLIYGLISLVLFAIGFAPLISWSLANSASSSIYSMDAYSGSSSDSPELPIGAFVALVMCTLIVAVVMTLMQSIMNRNAVAAVGGKNLTVGDFFNFRQVGLIFGVALVVQLAIQLGSIVYIGGIVVAFLFVFAAYAAAVPGTSFGDAFKSSFQVTTSNFVQTLLLMVFIWVASMAGMLALGVGLLVAVPVIALASAHAYLTATGGAIQTRA